MFGTVRQASLESLDPPPPKLLKDDSFSIYEATLLKLRLGSRRDHLTLLSVESMETESKCGALVTSTNLIDSMEMEPDHSSTVVSKSSHLATPPNKESMASFDSSCSAESRPLSNLQQQQEKNLSVLYLFSKYNDARNLVRSSDYGATDITVHGHANAAMSSSNCQSFCSRNEQSVDERCSSSSICHA